MKSQRRKLLRIAIAAGIALILLPVVVFVVLWEIDHRGRLLSTVETPPYRVSIYYYPGGFGTNPETRAYASSRSKEKQLLVYADAHDTASVFFKDSVTAGVILYSRSMTEPWDRYPCDTLYFKLNERITPVNLPSIAP